ncbi:MAG: hypothetical protein KDK99_05320 [Verrucomicrobiales bacterium]|nr:hypothetical protein [Verrucomicrobiales bacterium]
MRTRRSDPDFPLDIGIQFIILPIAIISWLFSTIMLDRGWLWCSAYWLGVVLVCVGGAHMFFAKLPFYRQGRFLTFGATGMTEASKVHYIKALKWIFGGMAITMSLLISRYTLT